MFKDIGKHGDGADTLYFNAFTEDLFSWENDLPNDSDRILKINKDSIFLSGLNEFDMNSKIGLLLERYADFDFMFDDEKWEISFARDVITGNGGDARSEKINNIKVSRSEESIFIWCFFLAILQLALDGDEAYKWVRYVYIDDPISSLDENNAVAVANHLSQMLIKSDVKIKTVIFSHHALFFNVLCNNFKKKAHFWLLKKDTASPTYLILDVSSKPFLHHLATLVELNDACKSREINRHHFNMMRCIMEQTAIFLGLNDWQDCIKTMDDDTEKAFYKRIVDVMSHADYLINEPRDLPNRYKDDFCKIFQIFVKNFPFNQTLLSEKSPA